MTGGSIYYLSFIMIICIKYSYGRDEELIKKACYWPHEVYDRCYGGCAEITCDNPENHQRACYPYCEPGCICEEPFVRDDRTHQCVLPVDCTVTQIGVPVKKNSTDPTNQSSNKRTVEKFSDGKKLRRRGGDEDDSNEEDGTNADDFSRLGNYFNIVIAPSPVKTDSRKTVSQKDSKKKKKNGSNGR